MSRYVRRSAHESGTDDGWSCDGPTIVSPVEAPDRLYRSRGTSRASPPCSPGSCRMSNFAKEGVDERLLAPPVPRSLPQVEVVVFLGNASVPHLRGGRLPGLRANPLPLEVCRGGDVGVCILGEEGVAELTIGEHRDGSETVLLAGRERGTYVARQGSATSNSPCATNRRFRAADTQRCSSGRFPPVLPRRPATTATCQSPQHRA